MYDENIAKGMFARWWELVGKSYDFPKRYNKRTLAIVIRVSLFYDLESLKQPNILFPSHN